jgi:hypothetical protein
MIFEIIGSSLLFIMMVAWCCSEPVEYENENANTNANTNANVNEPPITVIATTVNEFVTIHEL